MNGVIRFGLFVAVVGLIGLGVYANNLHGEIAKRDTTIAAVTADRDAWKTKFEQQQTKVSDDAKALEQAQTQVHDLQAQLEEAKKPQPRARRR
ncbi:MAG: hypothetical protein ACYCZX_15125 [Rhodospirillaceae bacterium]